MREVTERDFRKEEFRDAKPEDYEFRADGAIVRKDRWEIGIYRIASILRIDNFEIDEVVERVREFVLKEEKEEDEKTRQED